MSRADVECEAGDLGLLLACMGSKMHLTVSKSISSRSKDRTLKPHECTASHIGFKSA
jgi:hypothetical protein